MRGLVKASTVALVLASSVGVAAEQGGTLIGTPLPDKHVTALLFASRDVSDLAVSIRFYTNVLGLRQVGKFDYGDGSRQEVFLAFDDKPESAKIALQRKERAGAGPLPKTDGLNRIVFQVTDIASVRERAVRYGGQISGDIYTVSNVSMAGIIDPDGHRIQLLQQL